MLTDHLVALRVVDQGREIDQVGRVQGDTDWIVTRPIESTVSRRDSRQFVI
jgi:hypothetical protein